MKKIALLLVVALVVGVAPADARVKKSRVRKARTTRVQNKSISRQAGTCDVKAKAEMDTVTGMGEVYKTADVMPVFPGGEAALLRYLSANIQYPPEAAMNNVQGRVVVQFIVGKNGAVSDVRVVRSLDPYLDREAVRVCKCLPDFTPGLVNGHPVKVFYTLPISFKLSDDS